MEIPISTTPTQLEKLLNQLLNNEDEIPYAFYINEDEILTNVENVVKDNVSNFLYNRIYLQKKY